MLALASMMVSFLSSRPIASTCVGKTKYVKLGPGPEPFHYSAEFSLAQRPFV
jgi:hypothetical protein